MAEDHRRAGAAENGCRAHEAGHREEHGRAAHGRHLQALRDECQEPASHHRRNQNRSDASKAAAHRRPIDDQRGLSRDETGGGQRAHPRRGVRRLGPKCEADGNHDRGQPGVEAEEFDAGRTTDQRQRARDADAEVHEEEEEDGRERHRCSEPAARAPGPERTGSRARISGRSERWRERRAYFPSRALTSAQFTTFHQAPM